MSDSTAFRSVVSDLRRLCRLVASPEKLSEAVTFVYTACARDGNGQILGRKFKGGEGEMLSKNLFVPMLEKLLADGAIHEYEIDTEAIHTEDPGTFAVVIVAASGEGLDKFNAAVADLHKTSPFAGPAIGSVVDFSHHRDFLTRSNATFK